MKFECAYCCKEIRKEAKLCRFCRSVQPGYEQQMARYHADGMQIAMEILNSKLSGHNSGQVPKGDE